MLTPRRQERADTFRAETLARIADATARAKAARRREEPGAKTP